MKANTIILSVMNKHLKCFIFFFSFFIYHLLFSPIGAHATPDISAGKCYRFVCQQFTNGCVTDGATAGQNTPLYYLSSATTDNVNYWIITEENDGYYSIKNAQTGQYITYDGVRLDSPQLRRYISMTDEMNGNYSLWMFSQQSDGVYAIRNAMQYDHLWDVRVDSYCVGTYSNSNSANANQRFLIYDQQGNQVKEKTAEPVTTNGHDVSSWLVATTESPEGWTYEGSGFSDPGFGTYRNGSASVISPFLERWQESGWGGLPNNAMKQTLEYLPAGSYILSADIISVLQPYNGWWSISEEEGYGVYLFADNQRTEAGTRNERPEHYTVNFTIGNSGTTTVGLRIEDTNANWVAIDNFTLHFQGSQAELLAGEKVKVRAELSDYYGADDIETMIAACGDDFDALEKLRKSVANMPTIDPLSRIAGTITINGHAISYAESIDLYLCSVPLEQFGNEYTATISYTPKEGAGTLFIQNRQVTAGSQYTFSTIRSDSKYKLSIKGADGNTVNKNLSFTSLPVVRLYGSFNNNYSDGHIMVNEPDMEEAAEMLNMKAKWRGGITNGSDKHKRNYHVKLKDADGEKLEKKFFGLRNDNSWILESCQVDMSRIRNRVLTDLWNDYSTPPYYKDKEKKAKTGTRGQFIELILNDEYRGIYCMTENIDRKQMQLVKHDDETNTTHGELWKAKDWSYAVFMGPNRGHYQPADYLSTPNQYSEMWDSYQVKFPDFEDYGKQTDWTTLYNAVDFVCHTDDNNFREHVAEYFDIPVVMDYYLLMECILATDNHGKNQFYAVYDKQKDKKITFAVWDMDATCGQRWSDQYYHWNGMQPEQDYCNYIYNNEHGENNLYKRLRELDPDNFNLKMRMRYNELRGSYLATESILQRFRTYLDEFKTCGAAQREYGKWNGDSDISGLSLNFDDEMEYLTDWITRRMNYLDTERFDIATLPTDISESLSVDRKTLPVYNMKGQKVADGYQVKNLPAGIYIIGGKKVIVK